MLFPRNLQEEEHRIEDGEKMQRMESRWADEVAEEFQDEDDIDEDGDLETQDQRDRGLVDQLEDMVDKRIYRMLKVLGIKHSPEKAPRNCNCEEKRICYGCGEKGHLKNQCPKTNTNGNGSKDGNHHHHGNHHVEESFSGKCYRCMRAGHIARECFARKTLDGVMLPIPGEEKGKVTHLTDGEVPLPKQKMSVIHERDEEGEVDVSSAEEDY